MTFIAQDGARIRLTRAHQHSKVTCRSNVVNGADNVQRRRPRVGGGWNERLEVRLRRKWKRCQYHGTRTEIDSRIRQRRQSRTG